MRSGEGHRNESLGRVLSLLLQMYGTDSLGVLGTNAGRLQGTGKVAKGEVGRLNRNLIRRERDMSTRCNIIVQDGEDSIQLYRHSDGYPQGQFGVIAKLKEALRFSWPLPRMEAAEFSAAIVRAWKEHEGNIYIDGDADGIASPPLHCDIEYLYVVEPDRTAGKWKVTCHDISFPWNESRSDRPEVDKIVFEGHIGDEMPEKVKLEE